jgi:hypothetical protein
MRTRTPPLFFCPNCDALYQVVKVEAAPQTGFHEIACRSCGTPLPARDGDFVLKYFLLRTAAREQRWSLRKAVRTNK